MAKYINIIATPLSTPNCSTCALWGGARKIQNNCSNTGVLYVGVCKLSSEKIEQNGQQKIKKLSTHTDCSYWMPIKSD
jgi:hypothetical protein